MILKKPESDIVYTIERRNRKTISIQVHRDGRVRVLAPKLSSKRQIQKIIEERSGWIRKKQAEFAARPLKTGHRFETGEHFNLLGNKLDFEFIISGGPPGVSLHQDKIVMRGPEDLAAEKRRKLMQEWYRAVSKDIFAERIQICAETASIIGIKKAPEWKSRVLKRSWGSCSPKGKINLNLELAAAPVELIDYVILHELCHLIEHNHSSRFYKLMTRLCPDWKMKRKELNRNYDTQLV